MIILLIKVKLKYLSTNLDGSIVEENIRRNLKVSWSRTSANTTSKIVVRTMARAEVTLPSTLIRHGNATQVSADTHNDEEMRLGGTISIKLRILHSGEKSIILTSDSDLLRSTMTDENRLSAILDRHVLTNLERRQINLNVTSGHEIFTDPSEVHGGTKSCTNERERSSPRTGSHQIVESAAISVTRGKSVKKNRQIKNQNTNLCSLKVKFS